MHISSSYAKTLGGNYFTHGRFPEVGQKQKTERKREKYAWRTQARMAHASRLDQKKKRKKVSENNGQVRFRPPPRVAHASRRDQKKEEERKSVLTMQWSVFIHLDQWPATLATSSEHFQTLPEHGFLVIDNRGYYFLSSTKRIKD